VSLFRFFPERLKTRLRRRAGVVLMEDRIANLRAAGFRPRKVIDAGAFHGEWSLAALEAFPEASFLLIEPQPHLSERLKALCLAQPRCKFEAALLGAESSEAVFLLEATNSRIIAPGDRLPANAVTVKLPVSRLEELAARTGFSDCDYLKLDLQGHELNALSGAGELFGSVEVIQIEVSVLRIGEVPLAHEVIARFEEKGYRLYDIFGFNYRPKDRALWQIDFIFVRRDSVLISSRDWS
jgi:FkbM family methyltransferase